MDEKTSKELQESIETTNLLLALLLKKMDVAGKDIAAAMNISEGRLSQLLNSKKYRRKNK